MWRTLGTVVRFCLPAAGLFVASVFGAAPAAAATAIGPNQYFVGNVNGSAGNASILVGCFGPVGGTGHPLQNQYVLASQVPASTTSNVGFTGSAANSLVVSLRLITPSGSTGTYLIGTLTRYDTKLAIPTTLDLPCSATGNAVFAPAPTSPTAKSAVVSVTVVGQP
jgi:hypothetical protein